MSTSSENPLFPQQNEERTIGLLAEQCFKANHPITWTADNLSGDADVGYDFFVQISQDSQVKWPIKVQLKGTKSPNLNATEEFFSIDLKAATVRYYQNATEPILLVLADLSIDPDRPKNCPLYHVWIDDEIKRFNKRDGTGLPDDKKYVTFRVPKADTLENDTNLIPSIIEKLRIAKVGIALHEVVEHHRPNLDRSAQISISERLPDAIKKRGSNFIDVLLDEEESLWPEPKLESIAWYLTEATKVLKSGKITEAEELLGKAKLDSAPATALERAESYYIEGRIHAFRDEDNIASTFYAQAYEAAPSQGKYVAAWAEMQLRLRYDPDLPINDFSDVIEKLTGSHPLVMNLKVRILAAQRKYDEAIQFANGMDESNKWGSLATVYVMESKFEEAIQAASKGLENTSLKDNDKQVLMLMRARSRFYLATRYVNNSDPNAVYPLTGGANTDIPMLKKAWEDTLDLIEQFRQSNWPPNTNFISDLWASMASVLNKQKEILPLLKQAAKARPSTDLQASLELIAGKAKDYTTALAANALLPESSPQILRRLHLLHLANRYSEFIELLSAKLPTLDRTNALFGAVLVMGIISAQKIVRSDVAQEWEEILSSSPDLAEDYAVHSYFNETTTNRVTREKALERLENDYEKLGRPLFVGIHVFHELDSTIKEQAEKIVSMTSEIEKDRKLTVEGLIHLAQALTTLGKWDDLLALTKRALEQYENHERFRGIEALALDRLGKSSEARESLQQLIDAGIDEPFAVNIYLNIVVRSGFTDEAINSIESILAQQNDRSKKFQCLQLLFNLVYFSSPDSPRCIEVLFQIGDLVDQSKEDEEGSFLVKFLMGTQASKVVLREEKLAEVRSRMESFFQRFPNSSILKRGTLPENGNASEIISAIEKMIGSSPDQRLFFKKMENELRTGTAPVPFAWRPRNILQNISDVPLLWEINKRSKKEERQYHLTMVQNDFQPTKFAAIKGRIPLFDLTSLLVIQDLELLDYLFKIFPKIAIGQATITGLNELIRPMSGSVYKKRCQALQDFLKKNFSAIEQPYVERPQDDSFGAKNWDTGEIVELSSTGKYMLYSDDLLFRIYCQIPVEHQPAICTLDLLALLEEKNLLSEKEVARKIALLCSWHVDLVIQNRYLMAVIPDEILSENSLSKCIEILHASKEFGDIYNAIWDIALPYQNQLSTFGILAHQLVIDPAYKSQHVASFLMMWNSKAYLRTDVQQTALFALRRSILQIAFVEPRLNETDSKKLMDSYIDAIQSIYGDRMDESIEAISYAELGQDAARDDIAHSFDGEKSLGKRLARGFTPNTALSDRFNAAYASGLITASLEKNKK